MGRGQDLSGAEGRRGECVHGQHGQAGCWESKAGPRAGKTPARLEPGLQPRNRQEKGRVTPLSFVTVHSFPQALAKFFGYSVIYNINHFI